MTSEERTNALRRIGAVVPDIVFERFIMILTQIEESNNDALVCALDRMCRKESDGFAYRMTTGENKETITPIREVLDLFEGWILTATVSVINDRVKWDVSSIIGKELY